MAKLKGSDWAGAALNGFVFGILGFISMVLIYMNIVAMITDSLLTDVLIVSWAQPLMMGLIGAIPFFLMGFISTIISKVTG